MTPVDLQRHLIAFGILHGGLGDYGTRADGRRDDDGDIGNRTLFAMADYRIATDTMALMQPELHEHLRDAVRSPRFVTHDALGLRTLAFALREWCAGVKEEPPGSNGGPRIRDYFAACMRNGKHLGLTSGEWCAAAASWCAFGAIKSPADAPHGYRASGLELQRDLESGDYKGRWLPVSEVRDGVRTPRPGDLVVLDRSGGWTRHVCRLVALRGETLWTIGGNEGDEWRLTPRRLSDAQVLGFGAYPAESWTKEDERRVAELCPGTAARMASEAVCR